MNIPTGFDCVEVKECLMISPDVLQKTVGQGKDFESLHKALRWAETVKVTGTGSILLILDDGTHELGEPSDFNQTLWSYYRMTSDIKLLGSSAAACKITLPATDDGDMYPNIFAAASGCNLDFTNVTIDPGLNGYPYPSHVVAGYAGFSYIYLGDCIVSNFSSAFYSGIQGHVKYYRGTIDSCGIGYDLAASGATGYLDGTTISNCTTGVSVSTAVGSSLRLKGCTLTGNTTNYAIPLNEIQYDGSYISDGTAALTLKA